MNNNNSNQDETLTAAMDASHPLWMKEWKEGKGEETIRQHSTTITEEDVNKNNKKNKDERKVQLYCSWFCPFAQRVWITLEELGIPYQYIEVNPYRVDPTEPGGYTKQSLSLEEKKKLVPNFIATSPRGLVPAIRHKNTICVWESEVVVEYLDEVFSNSSSLFTSIPAVKAFVRMYIDHCTTRIQKSYYQFLMEQTIEGQSKAKHNFLRECRTLACAMAPLEEDDDEKQSYPTTTSIVQATEQAQTQDQKEFGTMNRVDVTAISQISHQLGLQSGPYFLGSQFSAVDIALAPFWQRILWVGKHYRNLQLPSDDPAFQRLDIWWKAVSQRPSIANTMVGKERLISSYKQYANNVATSDFATTMASSLSSSKVATADGSDKNNDDDDAVDESTKKNKRQKIT